VYVVDLKHPDSAESQGQIRGLLNYLSGNDGALTHFALDTRTHVFAAGLPLVEGGMQNLLEQCESVPTLRDLYWGGFPQHGHGQIASFGNAVVASGKEKIKELTEKPKDHATWSKTISAGMVWFDAKTESIIFNGESGHHGDGSMSFQGKKGWANRMYQGMPVIVNMLEDIAVAAKICRGQVKESSTLSTCEILVVWFVHMHEACCLVATFRCRASGASLLRTDKPPNTRPLYASSQERECESEENQLLPLD